MFKFFTIGINIASMQMLCQHCYTVGINIV